MVLNRFILSAVIGGIVGMLSGWLGNGGSVYIIIGLLLSGVVKTQAEAAGIALLVLLFPSNALAVWEYYKRGKIDIMLGIVVTISYLLLSGYGAKINALVSEKATLTANVVLQFLSGILFIYMALNN